MKNWQATGGGRDGLRLFELPKPRPRKGEILVRVNAVSLNYRDRLMIDSDAYSAYGLPFTPCSDLAGEVEALGADAAGFAVGDRVIANFTAGWIDGPPPRLRGEIPSLGGPLPGVLSEYVSLPAGWFVKAPAGLDDVQASTLPCTALTAWTCLFELGGLKPGQTVVLQGTGSVSLFALQFASAMGAEVIVTTTSDAKAERVKSLGAHHVVNRADTRDWTDAVSALTRGRGADCILEIAGGANLGKSVAALAPGGRIFLLGVIEGFESSFPSVPAIHAFATIQAVYVGHRHGLENMVRSIEAKGLAPVVDTEFSFAEFPEALGHLERGPFGKVVIRV